MKVIQAYKKEDTSWEYLQKKESLINPLVLVFGNRFLLEDATIIDGIRQEFPYEEIVFGSTSGEILDCHVNSNTISVTLIEFERSTFIIETENIFNFNKNTYQLGLALFKKIKKEKLRHLFVISEGSFINGSALIESLEQESNNLCSITGGLCGDDKRFEKTIASYKENPKEGEVILIGFYGETLEISFSSFGGWMPFGPERMITKSKSNVLYEIDDKPALDLYKKYLGEKASELPKLSMYYPLNVTYENKKKAVVRTVLGIDNETNSMILAGDAPERSKVQLMMATLDDIVDGAEMAAKQAMETRLHSAELAIVVSCVGRKLVMNQRIEEEIEQVRAIIGNKTAITGFYSYGEIAPFYGNT